jgi:dTDP-4-dehydrorhamnose 3,5-epimerase
VKVIAEFPEGLISFYPSIFSDDRGLFLETFQYEFYANHLGNYAFLQDNLSKSHKGVLRGLHFQAPPFDQGKLVQVIAGSVLDVAVDLRKNSPSFGKHFKIILDAQQRNQLWIPPGFAHGFLSLEDDTLFSYKCTNTYSKDHEGCLRWNDPVVGIDWGIENPIVSEKDQLGTLLHDLQSPF